jgi:hypothetical protein
MPAKTRRVKRGSGHSYELDGVNVDGVTTLINNGVPKPALVQWSATATAGFAVDEWDRLAELTPSKRLAEISRGRFAEQKAATVRGTTVHKYAHELAAGLEVEVPDELVGYVDAYLAFVAAYNVRELEAEATVVNRRRRYMGTVDLIAEIDGEVWLIDYKTSKSGIYSEVALQLAAYRNAETILDDDGSERPMPAIDRTAAVWLRADGYDVIPVEAGEAVFRTFLYVQQVAHFSTAPKSEYVLDALPPRELVDEATS